MWELSSALSADGTRYCFLSPGAYKIGRKDCAVSIPTDKTVSRVHAEFIVQPLKQSDTKTKCEAIVKDLSKFGTFVNKTAESKPVFQLPNNELKLKDSDQITFGTGSSTYRVKYLHFFFCVSALQSDDIIARASSALGAHCVTKWNPECTHVLVEEGSRVSELVLMAVSHHKPIVSLQWFEALTDTPSPAGDLPKHLSYPPVLKFQLNGDSSVRVVDPKERESTFNDVVLLAGPLQKYHYKELLRSLVCAGGGRLEFILNRSKLEDSKKQQVILVPHGASEREVQEEFTGFQHLQRIKEESLVLALLAGCRDNSAFYFSPKVEADESQSTDATVDLQDIGDDADSVADTPQPAEEKVSDTSKIERRDGALRTETEDVNEAVFCHRATGIDQNPDEFGEVKYISCLCVEPLKKPAETTPRGPNYKRFRRVGAIAGNSFQAFVPFAPQPYGETAYSDEIEEYMRQEKKRVADQRVADALFEKDDLKRRKNLNGESLAILKEPVRRRK